MLLPPRGPRRSQPGAARSDSASRSKSAVCRADPVKPLTRTAKNPKARPTSTAAAKPANTCEHLCSIRSPLD
ncbi:hypothetical protein EYF80_035332 [Liparis tanakae]|uniref:Uncharacterized protein n=1 Tax=Liparis tanakae TaxID=230148 RepID=A0A4Z2GNN6_9TELE|nr:hypothetical protein EYF80_035332 [Liparis tanakae]